MSWINDGLPNHRIDPPTPPEAVCSCGHCYDDHDGNGGMCNVCDCISFSEWTAEDEAAEQGDMICDLRRECYKDGD